MDKNELPDPEQLPLSVLIVDDDPQFAEAMAETLSGIDAVCESVRNRKEAEKTLGGKTFDVVITDLILEGEKEGGLDILRHVKKSAPETEVILMTTNAKVENVVKAMQSGAYSYLTKPPESLQSLRTTVQRAGEKSRLRRQNREMRERLDGSFVFGGVIGSSPAMLNAVERLKRIAPTDASVLILGETGTGKELFARAIHENSPRKDKNFVALNCAALSESILESELFGHVKGAFTDASSNRVGKFEYAQGGTVFLDEVGDMPLSIQVKLLRVLESREITRVGSNETSNVNVRIISATNRNLEEAVKNHTFREDLYYRLGQPLRIPSLRERAEDIPILLDKYLRDFSKEYGKPIEGVSQSAREKLLSYEWPGNVRELRRDAESMVLNDLDGVIDDDDLPEDIPGAVKRNFAESASAGGSPASPAAPLLGPGTPLVASLVGRTAAEVEKMLIEETLRTCGGNRAEAAEMLGMSVRSLYRRLNEYEEAKKKENAASAGG